MRTRFMAVVATVGALALVPTAAATGYHQKGKATTLVLSGGATSVTVSDTALGALTTLGIAPAPLHPGSLNGATFAFPIPIGVVDADTLAGQVWHVGGISLTKGATKVELRRFIVNIDADPDLTGLVSVNGQDVGRVSLFDLDLSGLQPSIVRRHVTLGNVKLKLTAGAAGALNGAFGVTAFAGGLDFGTATVQTSIVARFRAW